MAHQYQSGKGTITFDPLTYTIHCASSGSTNADGLAPQPGDRPLLPFVPVDELLKLTLILTENCNLSCGYCCARPYRSNASMSQQTIDRAIATFLDIYPRVRSIVFFGGEPLLDFETLRRTVERHGRRLRHAGGSFGVITNGTLITESNARFLAEAGVRVTVSCDGPPSVNDRQRVTSIGQGTSQRVEAAMDLLIRAGVSVNAEVTFTKTHVERGVSVLATLEYLTSRGAQSIHVVPVCGEAGALSLRDEDLIRLAPEFRAAARASITSLASGDPVIFKSAFYVLEALSLRHSLPLLCFAGSGVVSAHPDGTVYPCYLLHDPSLAMGNVHDPGFSDHFRAATERYRKLTKTSFAACSACWAATICFSCLGPRFMESGDLGPPSPGFCGVQRSIIEGALEGLAELRTNTDLWPRALEEIRRIYRPLNAVRRFPFGTGGTPESGSLSRRGAR